MNYSDDDDDILQDGILDDLDSAPSIDEPQETQVSGLNRGGTVGGIPLEGLPEELKKSLHNYTNIHKLETQTSSRNISPDTQVIIALMNFIADMSHYREDGPLIAATAAVADELSGGRVRLMCDKYEAERVLMYSALVDKFCTTFKTLIEDSDEVKGVFEDIVGFINTSLTVNDFQRQGAKARYLALCEELDLEVDQVMVEEGKYGIRTYVERIALGMPPGNLDAR